MTTLFTADGHPVGRIPGTTVGYDLITGLPVTDLPEEEGGGGGSTLYSRGRAVNIGGIGGTGYTRGNLVNNG